MKVRIASILAGLFVLTGRWAASPGFNPAESTTVITFAPLAMTSPGRLCRKPGDLGVDTKTAAITGQPGDGQHKGSRVEQSLSRCPAERGEPLVGARVQAARTVTAGLEPAGRWLRTNASRLVGLAATT